ncbi:MAG: S46 family peptidase [Candidatus Aminicenantes bacterium]|nr:S46 family peptidase [Candidatus Aminicenantes bacterium]
MISKAGYRELIRDLKYLKISAVFFLILGFVLVLGLNLSADEGMYPLSEIPRLDLQSKGLKIDPALIYDPARRSLLYAVVQMGATGSFISEDGLIITNHHVAFGAVQAVSTPDKDYLKNGFLARTRAEEIPAPGRTARITESFRDVSAEVLGVIKKGMSSAERAKAVEKQIKKIVAEAEKANPGKRAEVAEMFPGKSYWLFLYTDLKDIRLVYVPPLAVGNFGGEEDNWMWPRHTGDFTLLRAYVAPDGSPAEYSEKNVPFKPRTYLKVNPEGVKTGDFVFLLGYPGRTYRHLPASYLAFEQNVRMPAVADWYEWQIKLMEKMGKESREVALKHDVRIKGLANTMKNYRGKLAGLKKLNFLELKREEEKKLQRFILSDPRRQEIYGRVLPEMEKIYARMAEEFPRSFILDNLRRSVLTFQNALMVVDAVHERQKPDLERRSAYMDRNFQQAKKRITLTMKSSFYLPTDMAIFKELLKKAAALPDDQKIEPLSQFPGLEGKMEEAVERLFKSTRMSEAKYVLELMDKKPEEIKQLDDPMLKLAWSLYPEYQRMEEINRARKGLLDELQAKLVEVRQAFLGKQFIPDANGTLRLTYGRVEGYSPKDAVFYLPFTSLKGIEEKSIGQPPFDTPAGILDLIRQKKYGQLVNPELKNVSVCFLYSTDTTGGNSGSPVLNARGELVGVNFDRVWEATINDYTWSQDFSRSIGVDIRYVLWIMKEFAGAKHLLKEMGIE